MSRRPEDAYGYWQSFHAASAPLLADSTELPTFLASLGDLSLEERKVIVEQALILLDRNYVHLPLKRAMHGVDPVQMLKLLQFRLAEMTPGQQLPPEIQFHDEMQQIFTSVRDLHTNYGLPSPYNDKVAFLPFLLEEFFEFNAAEPRFMVSHVASGFDHPTFKPGVEVLYWNGVPIKRAIEINGESQAGSNLDARFARGLDALTIRPLGWSLPPDEEWVTVVYRTPQGQEQELKQEWVVYTAAQASAAFSDSGAADVRLAIDIRKQIINQTRKVLFAPAAIAAQDRIAAGQTVREAVGNSLETAYPDVLRAYPVQTSLGEFGYIRIFNFEVEDTDAFVHEFARLARALPQRGLIIDVRGNGGGVIPNGERLLQLLTPRRIEPESFEMINTALNLELCRVAPSDYSLKDWANSIAQSVETGATYSLGFPLSSRDECNAIGQIYYGPVLLIVDALCYSTTDIFVAGFQDHQIGEILGTTGNIGAGGGNVWSHQELTTVMSGKPGSPYKPLPRGTQMRVALRRSIRVGQQAGTPLEEFGVIPDHIHRMSRRDLTEANADLIDAATQMLAAKPARQLLVSASPAQDGVWTLNIGSVNIGRVDAYLDNHAYHSMKISDGASQIALEGASANSTIVLEGFDPSDALVASYLGKLGEIAAASASPQTPGVSPQPPAQAGAINIIVSYRSIARAYEMNKQAIDRAVNGGVQGAAIDSTEMGSMLSSFGTALKTLESAERTPGVLISPCDRDASLLQTHIAKNAAAAGKIEPVATHPGLEGVFETKFNDHDLAGWIGSFFHWIKGIKKHPWIQPPLVPEPLDNPTQIALLGDWGTNMYGAPDCAKTIEADGNNYNLLIHLGDVYYSGDKGEVQNRFLDHWPNNPGAKSRALNSNHEMYTGGYGYFDETLVAFHQGSSCVALQNDNWLVLGLDTGYRESIFNGWQGGIDDDHGQLSWVRTMIQNAGSRKVVLMSHHQPFTVLDARLDNNLTAQMHDILSSGRVFAWYWGHEHRCVIYDRHPIHGYFGRCIGHSGYPYFRVDLGTAPNDPTWPLFRRIPGKPTLPGGLVLDAPNPYLTNDYGAQGFMKLVIQGSTIHETVHLPKGEKIYENALS